MAKDEIRTLRLADTIAPFGIGAIVDILGESLMAKDGSGWNLKKSTEIDCKRLADSLGVAKLFAPPSVPAYQTRHAPGLSYARFPGWLFCQDCYRMRQWRYKDETGDAPECPSCNARMVPMRFISVCKNGSHAADISWPDWVHRSSSAEPGDKCQQRDQLRFETARGASQGLGGLRVSCDACRTSRSLAELSGSGALTRDGFRCQGKQPWQSDWANCDEPLEVLQRGATNVHFAELLTALDIPAVEGAERDITAEVRAHPMYQLLASSPTGPAAPTLAQAIADALEVAVVDVLDATKLSSGSTESIGETRTSLLDDEYRAFRKVITEPANDHGSANFVVRRDKIAHEADEKVLQALSDLITDVVLVDRLREVRAFYGFRRYSPAAMMIRASLRPFRAESWLPATEGFGEGIFVSVDEKSLAAWEREPSVIRRVEVLEARRRGSKIGDRLPKLTGRLVMLHTLSHLVMRSLSFTSGYTSASLRERIYAGVEGQAGILIYTTSGDAMGTLGGLVRQGQNPRFAKTLLKALEAGSWCSNDPVCRESTGQGMNGLNLAACHACALSAETSCEHGNLLLDRLLLIGGDSTVGFFQEIVHDTYGAAVAQIRSSI